MGRTSTYRLLVILVGVRGDRTRNLWVGSRVFFVLPLSQIPSLSPVSPTPLSLTL